MIDFAPYQLLAKELYIITMKDINNPKASKREKIHARLFVKSQLFQLICKVLTAKDLQSTYGTN